MLNELHIRDFAIIEDLRLTLNPGFVVFTGETGAGKSIIIDAVEMVLGGRADNTFVRTGSEVALVEGLFDLEPSTQEPVNRILDREGLLDDPEQLLLGREIRREGRNICRVNGRGVSLSLLSEIGDLLVDVHGQSEHLSLLRVREHILLLDRYANDDGFLQSYKEQYLSLGEVRHQLEQLRKQEQDSVRKIDFLTFQINEVESANLQPGEDDALLEERSRLANAEQLARQTEEAITALDGQLEVQESAADLLGRVVHSTSALAKIDQSMEDAQSQAQAIIEQVSELVRRLRLYREDILFNPLRLNEVEERLNMITTLKRKYGGNIEAVLSQAETASEELENITHAEERLNELADEEGVLLHRLGKLGEQLTQVRQDAGKRLAKAIEHELADLHMKGANFGLAQRWDDDPNGAPIGDRHVALGPTGLDHIEFLVAPNPGEGLKPLAKIASGGETSRLMLGLKSVLAQADRTPTLIFDEIDQGIGGRVGAIIGEKLWNLTPQHQVLCITHLPQLASFGDQHIKVEKQVKGERTITLTHSLSDSERITEMASMLGGVTQANLESATELLYTASVDKAESQTGGVAKKQ
ncbi:MAG: DNA repair protein RecN [Anaerolineales bacterium]|nr:DNA repair protein RecN [Anaerolineales bacterium]